MRLSEIPPEVDPKPGESVEVSFDTNADLGVIHGERGTTYAFPVVLTDGRKAVLKGGKRLLNAIQDAIGNQAGTFNLKVTPSGQKGTLARDWSVVKVG